MSENVLKRKFVRLIGINILVVISSFLVCLLLFELTLRTGLFDDLDNPHPIWIPWKYVKKHRDINSQNWKFAKKNPYRFTDKIREVKKPEGTTRVAVLGDSVIWGFGIPFEQAWGHKLAKRVHEKYEDIEVMNWGFNAWSTADEVSFFEKHGIDFDIDLLIISYTMGDPAWPTIYEKGMSWSSFTGIKMLKIFFPNAVTFITSHINNYLKNRYPEKYKDVGYLSWINRIYESGNLERHAELLKSFSRFSESQDVELLFVFVPNSLENINNEKLELDISLVKQAGIKYFDLMAVSQQKLGSVNQRTLWVNPADRHPGAELTDLYSNEVFNYLIKEDVFKNILKKKEDKNQNKNQGIENALQALRSEYPEARESAILALGKMSDLRAIDSLIYSLKDQNKYVRMQAISALVKKDDPRITGYLIKALKDEDNNVRRRAIWGLGQKRDVRAVNKLIEALKDDSFYIRKTAIIALGKIKDSRVVEPLILTLKDRFSSVRIEAVEALAEIDDPRSIKALKDVSLNDSESEIRDTAAMFVERLTGEKYGMIRRKLKRMWRYF